MKLVSLFCIVLFPCHLFAQTSDSLSLRAIPHKLFWEKASARFSKAGDSLTIEAASGTDIYRDSYGSYLPNNAPRLLFQADSNFILTVNVRHAFSDVWNAGGILLEDDSTHWIKFCFERDNTGANRIVSVVTNQYSDDCNAVAIPANHVFLKMAKAGEVIILYYSQDGKSWYMARRLRYVFARPVRVGFLVQAPGSTGNTVHFSRIQYQLKKVVNPFGIE
jgi:regulation of enolase protein 1 (concanavalin A-like superfamily)